MNVTLPIKDRGHALPQPDFCGDIERRTRSVHATQQDDNKEDTMTNTAASRTRRPNLSATLFDGQHESVRPQAVTETAHRAPGLYWMKFNPTEKWTIARYGLTVASGQPGWELIGLPFATRECGDEMTRPVAQPVTVQGISMHRAPGLYWMKFNPTEKWTIARYGLTVASGQPGWELIGLPFATRERGDEITRPVAQPITVRRTSKNWTIPNAIGLSSDYGSMARRPPHD